MYTDANDFSFMFLYRSPRCLVRTAERCGVAAEVPHLAIEGLCMHVIEGTEHTHHESLLMCSQVDRSSTEVGPARLAWIDYIKHQ